MPGSTACWHLAVFMAGTSVKQLVAVLSCTYLLACHAQPCSV